MAPKKPKPKPKPTNKVATPWLSPKATPKPTAKPKATPKPMKSPEPPKYDIPKGIPAWQKKILEDEYEYKFGKYMEKVKAWEKSRKGR